MRFLSTRGNAPAVGFSETLTRGLAPDGGLYVPESFPHLSWDGVSTLAFPDAAQHILAPFLHDDPLHAQLPQLCTEAFNFPLPLTPLPAAASQHAAVLELFHGPTAAFKDFGARFLAACLARIPASRRRTILVATSGDTGGAVAAAFADRPGFRVIVLYPEHGVSARQEHQLTAWGDSVRAYAVQGTFDDCQRLVKGALNDHALASAHHLTTANSVNLGRILPQLAYHAHTACRFLASTGHAPRMIVPSGNVGNSVVAFWALAMGAPLAGLTFATNANRSVVDYLQTGAWKPRPSQKTLANAMDVGDPSNMERVFHHFTDRDALAAHADAISVSDHEIEQAIAQGETRWGRIWDPHTAAAAHALEALPHPAAVIFATAHPAKFETLVEPLIGHPVELPDALRDILARPSRRYAMANSSHALREVLETP